MNTLSRFMIITMAAPILCGAALVVGYVMIVTLTIPQLPGWAQPGVEQWLLDIPQDTEFIGGENGNSSPAGLNAVPWEGYTGPEANIYGFPLIGPIQHWSTWYDKPLLGCVFHDANYQSHIGVDLPVNEGTPVHTTMGGKVVWASENGPWGNLVVVENDGYQVWLAHLSSIQVSPGDILNYGEIVGLSGNTGNSTGAHVHYGIKEKTGENTYAWVNPQLFFTEDDYIYIGCSD